MKHKETLGEAKEKLGLAIEELKKEILTMFSHVLMRVFKILFGLKKKVSR